MSSTNRPRDWPLWLAGAGVPGLETTAAMTFDNAALAYQAAIDALGVVIAQTALIQDDLDSGRLVAPLAQRVQTPAFHPHRPKAPRIAAFEAWLMAEAAGA